MQEDEAIEKFGSWQDAERLREWSFLRRSPQQRLDWLIDALTVAYACGAMAAHRPASPDDGRAANAATSFSTR